MAGTRATYSPEDKARIYVVLTANEGNVKRTAREVGMPEATVRRWKKVFAEEGPPDTEMLEAARNDFVDVADRVRHKAILKIEELIDQGKVKVGELNTTVGILTDKIDRARGLATTRSEHVLTLPSGEEIRELLASFVGGQAALAAAREAEIVDAEIVEQAVRPALTTGR